MVGGGGTFQTVPSKRICMRKMQIESSKTLKNDLQNVE